MKDIDSLIDELYTIKSDIKIIKTWIKFYGIIMPILIGLLMFSLAKII